MLGGIYNPTSGHQLSIVNSVLCRTPAAAFPLRSLGGVCYDVIYTEKTIKL